MYSYKVDKGCSRMILDTCGGGTFGFSHLNPNQDHFVLRSTTLDVSKVKATYALA